MAILVFVDSAIPLTFVFSVLLVKSSSLLRNVIQSYTQQWNGGNQELLVPETTMRRRLRQISAKTSI